MIGTIREYLVVAFGLGGTTSAVYALACVYSASLHRPIWFGYATWHDAGAVTIYSAAQWLIVALAFWRRAPSSPETNR